MNKIMKMYRCTNCSSNVYTGERCPHCDGEVKAIEIQVNIMLLPKWDRPLYLSNN